MSFFVLFCSSFCLGVIYPKNIFVLKGSGGRVVILYGDQHTRDVVNAGDDDNPLWEKEKHQRNDFIVSLREILEKNSELKVNILHEHMESFGTNFLPSGVLRPIEIKLECLIIDVLCKRIIKGSYNGSRQTFMSSPIDQESLDNFNLSLFSIDPRFIYTSGLVNPETLLLASIKMAGLSTEEGNHTPALSKLKEQIFRNYESFLTKAFGNDHSQYLSPETSLPCSRLTLGDVFKQHFGDGEIEHEKSRILQMMSPRRSYFEYEANVGSMVELSELRLEYQVLNRIHSHHDTLSICIVGSFHCLLLLELLREDGFSVIREPTDSEDNVIQGPLVFLEDNFLQNTGTSATEPLEETQTRRMEDCENSKPEVEAPPRGKEAEKKSTRKRVKQRNTEQEEEPISDFNRNFFLTTMELPDQNFISPITLLELSQLLLLITGSYFCLF